MDKIQLKLEKYQQYDANTDTKEVYTFINQDGVQMDLKIYKDKEFKSTITVGDIGLASYSDSGWLNVWESSETNIEVKKPEPKKDENTDPVGLYSNQGAREGGLFHDATALYIAEYQDGNDGQLNLSRLKEIYEEIKRLI